MRTVVVVAHPDDETLWAGGYLAAHPGTDVICCTIPDKDPQRMRHFFQACFMLNAHAIVAAASLADDPDRRLVLSPAQALAARYDLILTHNQIGEYGHKHHVAVHEAMKATGRPMRVFGYGLTVDGESVDVEVKKRVLSVYASRPEVFQRQSKKFNLGKEAFL